MSSMNMMTNLSKYYLNTLFIKSMNDVGALVSPNGITMNLKYP